MAGLGAPPSAGTSIRPPGQTKSKQRPPSPPQVRGLPAAGRADVKLQSPQPRGGAGWANPLVRPRPHRTLRAARIPPAHLLDVHICRGWGRPAALSLSPPSPSLSGPSARLDRGSPPRLPAPSAAPRFPHRARSPLTQTKWRQTLPVPSWREPFSTT